MTDRNYFRLSLALPFLLGVAISRTSDAKSGGGILSFVLWIALVPYALFALTFLVWSMDQSTRRIRRGILLSPLLFSVVQAVFVFPLTLLIFGADFIATFMVVLPTSVAVGYACIGGVVVLHEVLRAIGLVRITPDS